MKINLFKIIDESPFYSLYFVIYCTLLILILIPIPVSVVYDSFRVKYFDLRLYYTKDSKLDISLEFLNGMTYEVKVEYLALNGWSLHLERYKGIYWEVAKKYMNRRKLSNSRRNLK